VEKVLFVSAGMLSPKKTYNPLWKQHLYLNYGLLGLASLLKEQGYRPYLVQGNFTAPELLVHQLAEKRLLEGRYPVFLSVPSVFASVWADNFCKCAKEEYPEMKIVVGGRWVTGTDGKWIRKQIPNIDLVVYGAAENRIKYLLSSEHWDTIPYTDITSVLRPEPRLASLPRLDYRILEDYEEYQPSIEISRGCGKGCTFCVEGQVRGTYINPPSHVIQSIIDCHLSYKTDNIHPYFEASCFRPSHEWAKELCDMCKEREIKTQWRCETRVDALSEDTVATLAEAGLKVIDFGLESASPKQLLLMNKTKDPKKYLSKASRVLKQCKSLGIWAKMNVLLYPGEDSRSIAETVSWLESHRDCIKGVSVGSTVVYRDVSSSRLLQLTKDVGGAVVEESAIEDRGWSELNLSRELDCDAAKGISVDISKSFMRKMDYFDLKSFTYFPRSLTFDTFCTIVNGIENKFLPFSE
jgi:hypothetical protein